MPILFDNCSMCCISKEQSIPALFLVRVCESTSPQSAQYIRPIFSLFCAYYFTICHPTYCFANHSSSSHGNSISPGLANVHIWTGKRWMQYSASHLATAAVLLSQNSLRSHLRASSFHKFPEGSCLEASPSLAWLCTHTYTYQTSLQCPF